MVNVRRDPQPRNKLRLVRSLVTGGAGFIGSNLVDALVARGDDVVVLDDLSSGKRENLDGALDAGAKLIEGDITDPDDVDLAFAEGRPDRVFHLAAQIDVRRSVADPAYDLNVNVAGTLGLLERLRAQGSGKLVFASTGGAIYGEGEGRTLPLAEDAEAQPEAPYGQSKLAAEGYLGLYRRMYGTDAVAMRLGNVYGPRQDPLGEAGVVAIFCNAMNTGATPRVFGDGEQTRDYIYVGDVAAAFIAGAEGQTPGPFNVGTGIETSVLELGARLGEIAGVEFDPEMAPARAGEVQRIAIDSSRAADELGWKAQKDLAEGLAETWAWVTTT
jgi:UDP-glucose 4-epimerase